MRILAKILAVAGLALVGCGDEGGDDNAASEPSAPQPTVTSEFEIGPPVKKVPPLAQADAYARQRFPEATDTDDALAAATSGCYTGITGEYLGGPEGWSIEKALKIEYPETELQAVFRQGRRDCEQPG